MVIKWVLCWTILLILGIGGERSQRSLEPASFPRVSKNGGSYNYSVIFDVGSTGTRVYAFAYSWNPEGCYGRGAIKLYMPGWSRKTRPGLGEAWQTSNAVNGDVMIEDYLKPLKEFILDEVLNESQLRETIYIVHATGGFRALDLDVQLTILDAMYRSLSKWPGSVERSWLRVLEGEEEGAYAWLAVNQLARRFYGEFEQVELHPELKSSTVDNLEPLPGGWLTDNWGAVSRGMAARRHKHRVGMIEVGGASAQVALEPSMKIRTHLTKSIPSAELVQPEPILSKAAQYGGYNLLKFCYQNFFLQIQTLDGFGREAAFQDFLRYQALKANTRSGERYPVHCLPIDVNIPVYLDSRPGSDSIAYAYGHKNGNLADCRKVMRAFLTEKNLSYQVTSMLDPDYRIYATENFYYFNQYVAKSNGTVFSTDDFLNSAQTLCNGTSLSEVKLNVHHEIAEEKLSVACFGLVFLSELMRMTVALRQDQLVKAVTAIKELETSYTVGSLLLEIPLIRKQLEKRKTAHIDEL